MVDIYTGKITELTASVAAWADKDITEENAGQARDVIGIGNDLAKEIDKTRAVEKKPHWDAGKAVDAAYKPLEKEAKDAATPLRTRLKAFLSEQKRKAEEERLAAERKAAEEKAAAEALANDALLADETAQAAKAAEAEARLAAAEEKAKASIKGTSGMRAMSMRTKRTVNITDSAKLVEAYGDHPDMIALAEKLANADLRTATGSNITNIPGCEIIETESLV